MAFDYDVSNPENGDTVSGYPTNARAFRVAVHGSMNVEHEAVEGRHTFGRGNDDARDAITTWSDGAVWWNTQTVTGETILQVYNGSSWLTTEFGLLDVSQTWTAIQSATYTAMGITASTLDLDWSDGHYQKYTLTGNLTLGAGTNKPTANEGATIVLELTQGAGFPNTLAYNAEYKFSSGVDPVLTTTAAAVDLVHLTLLSNGNVKVSIEWDIR